MVTPLAPPLLARWKGTILVTFALVLTAGVGLALSAPRAHESRATILIDRTTASGSAQDGAAHQDNTLETLETEQRVILSRATAEAVVVELGLEVRPRTAPTGRVGETLGRVDRFLADANSRSGREQWIRRITSRLKVSADANSSVLTIRYADRDAGLAKSIVAATARAYMNQRLGANAGLDLRRYYAQKLLDLRQRHAQLNALQEQNSVTAIGANRSQLVLDSKALQARISELKNDLQGRRAQAAEADAPPINSLRDEVRVVGSGLERLESQIDRLGSEVALTQNLGFMIDSLEQQMIDYQAKFAAAPTSQGTVELINVEIVEHATNPVPSKFPNLRQMFAAVVAALAAGLLAAFLRQFLGGQIRSSAQVEDILALPVYGSVGKYHP